jgi:hypothetical protein
MLFKEFLNISEAGLEHRAFNKLKKLQDIRNMLANQGIADSDIWVTFSEVPRITIWGRSATKSQGTPHALFAYPIQQVLAAGQDFRYYGNTRPYMVVFIANEAINDIGAKHIEFNMFKNNESVKNQDVVDAVYLKLANDESCKYIEEIHNYFTDEYIEISDSSNRLNAYWLNKDIFDQKSKQIARLVFSNILKQKLQSLKGFDTIFGNSVYQIYDVYYRTDHEDTDDIFSRIIVELSYDVKRIINSPYNEDKFKDLQQYTYYLNKQELIDFDKKIRQSGPGVAEIIENLKNDEAEIKASVRKFIKTCIKTFKQIKDQRLRSVYRYNFPKKKELTAFCKENGLSIIDALRHMTGTYKLRNKLQFVYRFTEQLALQWARKDGKEDYWPARWAMILKKIGFTNIADLQHTGAVHASEPTQAAFFDTRKLEMIASINNISHIDYRPVQSDDASLETEKLTGGKRQRQRDPTSSLSSYYGTPEEKQQKALADKAYSYVMALRDEISNLHYFARSHAPVPVHRVSAITGAIQKFLSIYKWLSGNFEQIGIDKKEIFELLKDLNGLNVKDYTGRIIPVLNRLKAKLEPNGV